jgi:hypothetical protein
LLQTVAETVFFYHPAIWWLSNQIRREREFCCDDIAVTLLGIGGFPASHPLNLGILAHVDAGKTSLTERLLFDNGTINRLGSVDAGYRADDVLCF